MVVVLLSMKATDWEFTNRALVFGLIFAGSFPLYSLDRQNSVAALASWLGPRIGADADHTARFLFAFAALVLLMAALSRSWACAYLSLGLRSYQEQSPPDASRTREMDSKQNHGIGDSPHPALRSR